MSPADKALYEEKARKWKIDQKKQPKSGRLDCTGQLIDVLLIIILLMVMYYSCIAINQCGQMIKSIIIVIKMVSVQNLLTPFCCVFGKDTLQHFSLFNGFDK